MTFAQRIAVFLVLCLLVPAIARAQLPHDPSELLIIGDSVAAGMYFLELEERSIRQSWTGQVLRRLGLPVPLAPFNHVYPIDHLELAEEGFGAFRTAYAWKARRALYPGKPLFDVATERTVLAIPGQRVGDVLIQSSKTTKLNEHSAAWIFASITLPKGLSAIETVEQWEKRPRWIVVFIGANDLLASFGLVGNAAPTEPATFRAQYAELVDRLRATMASDAPATQLIVTTLPDVTVLPFLQELPATADNGDGMHYPPGSRASTFLIPYRKHFDADEVWTPDELDGVHRRAHEYNAAIMEIAAERGLSVFDMEAVSDQMAQDPAFSSATSPYFSPDLHHPSARTHRIMADKVLETMASIAGVAVPDTLSPPDKPLPSAAELSHETRRVNAIMHLAVQGLNLGPLPKKFTGRGSIEAGAQGGDERVGDGTLSVMAGLEGLPVPVSTRLLVRICAHGRANIAAYRSSDDEVELFPARGLEGRLGLGFEGIGSWRWNRFELGGLITPDDSVDFGVYAREEWRMLYIEAASRGWLFDRIELGVRIGDLWGRPGRNGN